MIMVNILNLDPLECSDQYRGASYIDGFNGEFEQIEHQQIQQDLDAMLKKSDHYLSSGGYSQVYLRIIDKNLKAAVKVCKNENENHSKIIRNEVQILQKIKKSPNSFQFLNANVEKGIIICKFYENGDLFEQIKKLSVQEQRESVAQSLSFQIAQSLQQLHEQGIFHRDIKLENIYLDENFKPVIGDYGFALKNDAPYDYIPRGTISCWAPENFNNDQLKQIDLQKIDVFAFGVMLFEMIFLQSPFESAQKSDKLYKWFWARKPERYFEELNSSKNISLSKNLKNLFLSIFDIDSSKRLKVSDILAHSYFRDQKQNNEFVRDVFKGLQSNK